ncbi:MAG: WG repeat-containing protein [Algoriphagus sp.]
MRKLIYLFSFLLIPFLLNSCGMGSSREISLIPVENGNDYQYIDKEGKIVINPQFAVATAFREGLALVKSSGEKGKWGFINEEGDYIIPANFKEATVFSEELAWVVSENGAPTAIDTKGEIKFTLQDAEQVKIFKEGLAAFSNQGGQNGNEAAADSIGSSNSPTKSGWGFVDTEGKVVISPQFSATGNFSDGLCAVKNEEGKWGYIDKEGKLVIPHQFDNAGIFVDGVAVVDFDGKSGAIDEEGKYLINPQFENMVMDGDMYLIELNDKWGWADSEGKILINPQFDQAILFLDNDLAPVLLGDDVGFVDKEGKIKINPQFSGALPFVDGWAMVKSGDKYGIIDEEGKYLVNPMFDGVSDDVITYIVKGESNYESVETDFFNIAPIVSRINLASPEGLTLNSTVGDVVSKLKVSEDKFYAYSTNHTLLNNVRITSDASLNFSVWAVSHVEVPDGWYTKSVFNAAAPVLGFVYKINLSGRGYDKAEQVLAEIEKTIKGLQKDEIESAEQGYIVYKNATQQIYLQTSGNQVILSIFKANQEETGD